MWTSCLKLMENVCNDASRLRLRPLVCIEVWSGAKRRPDCVETV
jgi:hypothetical protein